jgi:uncharacterized protein
VTGLINGRDRDECNNTQGTALITGASFGIGAVYANRLARRGYDLIVVARSVEEILRSDSSITMLINNAGTAGVAPLLDSDVNQMEAMIDLNVTALTRLTYAVAPGFVARGKGTIVNIASIVAVAPELLNGVYGATKAFVLAFSQSLHHELAAKGVRVQAVLPGAIRTELWGKAGRPVENLPQAIVMDAEDLVDAALAGLDQGELATVPSLPDAADWDAFQSARAALGPNLSRSRPAARYGVGA